MGLGGGLSRASQLKGKTLCSHETPGFPIKRQPAFFHHLSLNDSADGCKDHQAATSNLRRNQLSHEPEPQSFGAVFARPFVFMAGIFLAVIIGSGESNEEALLLKLIGVLAMSGGIAAISAYHCRGATIETAPDDPKEFMVAIAERLATKGYGYSKPKSWGSDIHGGEQVHVFTHGWQDWFDGGPVFVWQSDSRVRVVGPRRVLKKICTIPNALDSANLLRHKQ